MRKAIVLVFVLWSGSLSSRMLMAQEPVPDVVPDLPQAPAKPVPQLDLPKPSNFAAQFLHDQREIWSSPLKLKPRDLSWLAPIGLGAAALMTTHGDTAVADAVRRSDDVAPASRLVSHFGSTQAIGGIAGGLWALGKVTHHDRLAEAGRLSTEAALQTQLVVGALKFMSRRERPNGVNNQSFPSGHAATSFAFASVFAHEYHDKPLIVIGSYGFATAVSLSRIGGLNHFPSDVVIGATIGELIGRYLSHRYHKE